MLKYAADIFASIYTWLGTALADAEVLMGDDTNGKVLEINEHLRDGEEIVDPPAESLIARIAESFGRVFPKKRGKGHKRKLNVFVVIGKTVPADPRSHILFFRAHLGSFGDLVSKILEYRKPKNRNLTIISDLATSNLLAPDLYRRFNVTHDGCGAHARRSFSRYRKQDEKLCY